MWLFLLSAVFALLYGITSAMAEPGSWHLARYYMSLVVLYVVHEFLMIFSFFPGPDNLENLKRLAEHLQKQAPGAGAPAKQDDDDDVPELVPGETFEAAADENQAS